MMYVLIVIFSVSRSSYSTSAYRGVTMQEFTTQESCQAAAKYIEKAFDRLDAGFVDTECVQK